MRRAPIAVVALLCLGVACAVPHQPSRLEQVVRMTARRFEYSPHEVTVKKDVPVVLEITSLDRHHGFNLRELGVRADIEPGEVTRVRILPSRTGRFPFECDVFCGDGHEDMSGVLIVTE